MNREVVLRERRRKLRLLFFNTKRTTKNIHSTRSLQSEGGTQEKPRRGGGGRRVNPNPSGQAQSKWPNDDELAGQSRILRAMTGPTQKIQTGRNVSQQLSHHESISRTRHRCKILTQIKSMQKHWRIRVGFPLLQKRRLTSALPGEREASQLEHTPVRSRLYGVLDHHYGRERMENGGTMRITATVGASGVTTISCARVRHNKIYRKIYEIIQGRYVDCVG